jgi:hypothetical protein
MCLAATWSSSVEDTRRSSWCALIVGRITDPTNARLKDPPFALITDATPALITDVTHGLITERAAKPPSRNKASI